MFHTDSFLPSNDIIRTPLQQVVKWADEKDEEVGGKHHYRQIDPHRAKESIIRLDQLIDEEENK